MAKPELDPREPRQLTSREVAKLLGATIAGLADMSSLQHARDAVRWWAENDDVWRQLEQFQAMQRKAVSDGAMAWFRGSSCPKS